MKAKWVAMDKKGEGGERREGDEGEEERGGGAERRRGGRERRCSARGNRAVVCLGGRYGGIHDLHFRSCRIKSPDERCEYDVFV